MRKTNAENAIAIPGKRKEVALDPRSKALSPFNSFVLFISHLKELYLDLESFKLQFSN